MKRSVKSAIPLILVCVMMASPGRPNAETEKVPCIVSFDFETAEFYGWESYPYAQDIGWDPRFLCLEEPTHPGSRFSLARMMEPNDVMGTYVGFTRQIDMWTSKDTRWKCLVYLTADRRPPQLELSICLLDGRRYLRIIGSPEVNRWLELDLPLGDFTANGRPLEAGQRIQAVTIKAEYPRTNDFISYTIHLDDFSLSGERPRRLLTVEPASTVLDQLNSVYLHRHYFFGDPLTLTVKPEGEDDLTRVVCDVLSPEGKAVVSRARLVRSGAVWKADKVYTFSSKDPSGAWRVNFTGLNPQGLEVKWGFSFLMPGKRLAAGVHPRLFFTAAELKKRLATQTAPEKQLLENALRGQTAWRTTDIDAIEEFRPGLFNGYTAMGPYSVDPGLGWRMPMTRLCNVIQSGAWQYALAGDEGAGLKAKAALLKLCSFGYWTGEGWYRINNHVHFPLGYVAAPAGLGYDLLYPLLTEQERQTVREAIVEKALKTTYRDLVEMNRMPSNLTNHIAVTVFGTSIAAAAIYGDEAANPSVEPWLSGILAKMKAFIDRTYYPDGGYGEPMSYQDMATRDLVQALDVLSRNFGVDYASTTSLKDTYLYPLYATYTNGVLPDFGDVSPRYDLAGSTFTWLSFRLKNPWTFDFVKDRGEPGREGVLGWLWYPKGVTPKSRTELVPSRHFPVKGNMVMRSGWEDAGSILAFRCGPNSNHYHNDQGTFFLFTNGNELLSDAGHGSSYYTNLYYPCYYTQGIGHNTMLVDGIAESQWPADYENGVGALRNYPKITSSFAGWTADEVEGDLTCVFRNLITGYRRSLLFLKPDILFLYDKVRSDQPHSYSWLFHAEHTNGKSSITYDHGDLRIDRPRARLDMKVLAPEIASSRLRTSDRDESFITLTSHDGLKDTEFLAVLRPAATSGPTDPAKKMEAELLQPAGWIGARIKEDNRTTLAMFRSGAPAGKTTVGGCATDADRFAVETAPDGTARSLFLRGTQFDGMGVSVRSSNQASLSVSFADDLAQVEAETAGTTLTLRLPEKPEEIDLNGSPASGWTYDQDSQELRLCIPEGHCQLTIK